jgi:hypothetical protein
MMRHRYWEGAMLVVAPARDLCSLLVLVLKRGCAQNLGLLFAMNLDVSMITQIT